MVSKDQQHPLTRFGPLVISKRVPLIWRSYLFRSFSSSHGRVIQVPIFGRAREFSQDVWPFTRRWCYDKACSSKTEARLTRTCVFLVLFTLLLGLVVVSQRLVARTRYRWWSKKASQGLQQPSKEVGLNFQQVSSTKRGLWPLKREGRLFLTFLLWHFME